MLDVYWTPEDRHITAGAYAIVGARLRPTRTPLPRPTRTLLPPGGRYATGDAPMRCPRGTAATSHAPGGVLARRLLVGGCMLADDAGYDPRAELHVPSACHHPRDLRKGCLVRGAVNYDPHALQVGACVFRVRGCTSPSALNFFSAATIDDGSCVEPVYGCTLPTAGYAAVARTTPGYRSRAVGVPVAHGALQNGLQPFPAYGSVLAHDSSANALRNGSCAIAIEGCMDPSAANFEPAATVNSGTWCVPSRFYPSPGCHPLATVSSGTWFVPSLLPLTSGGMSSITLTGMPTPSGGRCIPRVRGCMMPPVASGSVASNPRDTAGAANFEPSATVNVPARCVAARRGCTDSTMLNYDALANVDDGGCMALVEGCLDPTALNFNCTTIGERRCQAPRR